MSQENKYENVEAGDEVGKLMEQLNSEQLEDLRRRLNHKAWIRRFSSVYDLVEGSSDDQHVRESYGLKLSTVLQVFIEQLESGQIDQVLRQGALDGWGSLLHSIKNASDYTVDTPSDKRDTESVLEQHYEILQTQLVSARQAVAQAIASEKQLESQFQRCKDQAMTWKNRADYARSQGNEPLTEQALQRYKLYEDNASDAESQLQVQKENTGALRMMLTNVEGFVQKAYTRKQILIARDRGASAIITAQDVMSNFAEFEKESETVIALAEEMVKCKEEKSNACDLNSLGGGEDSSNDKVANIFEKLAISLERLTSMTEEVQQRLRDRDHTGKDSPE